ncbi:MAG: metal-dependent hydrolase [Anaerolineae bacterium]
MQTYSHFILTAVSNRLMKKNPPDKKKFPPLNSKALLIGSFAPDLPLTLIAAGTIITDLTMGNMNNEAVTSYTEQLFNDWFFNTIWVKTAHNLFHGPLPVLFYILLGYWAWKNGKTWGPALFWFAVACMGHTLIDIPIHYDDGPLLLFPFNFNFRFYSPVSYWDPERYGLPFTIFEHSLVLISLIWIWRDWQKSKAKVPT